MDLVIRDARPEEFPAIADLNVAAYRAFATQMSAEGWSGMERSLRAVEARAERATFPEHRRRGVGQRLVAA